MLRMKNNVSRGEFGEFLRVSCYITKFGVFRYWPCIIVGFVDYFITLHNYHYIMIDVSC